MSLARLILIALIFVIAAGSAGCSWPTQDGSGRTYLVFGLGFVTTADDTDQHEVGEGLDARAVHFETTGAFASLVPGMVGLLIGHLRRQTVEVAPDAELLLEAKTEHAGQMRLRVWRPYMPLLERVQTSSNINEESKP